MAATPDAVEFQEQAVELHRARYRAVLDEPEFDHAGIVAAWDLFGWAYRLWELRGGHTPKAIEDETPDRANHVHLLAGATWVRHRLAHGDAHLVSVVESDEIDGTWSSDDIMWSDPEVQRNGQLLVARTVRFEPVPHEVPDDKRPRLRKFYNVAVSRRRVLFVSEQLAKRPRDE